MASTEPTGIEGGRRRLLAETGLVGRFVMVNRLGVGRSALGLLVSPLVPPILIAAGIVSYTALGVAFDGDTVQSRRAIDSATFILFLVASYGVLMSYVCTLVFVLPLHVALRVLRVGGYLPYTVAGAVATTLFVAFGIPDEAMLDSGLEPFSILCGAIAGGAFWRIAGGPAKARPA